MVSPWWTRHSLFLLIPFFWNILFPLPYSWSVINLFNPYLLVAILLAANATRSRITHKAKKIASWTCPAIQHGWAVPGFNSFTRSPKPSVPWSYQKIIYLLLNYLQCSASSILHGREFQGFTTHREENYLHTSFKWLSFCNYIHMFELDLQGETFQHLPSQAPLESFHEINSFFCLTEKIQIQLWSFTIRQHFYPKISRVHLFCTHSSANISISLQFHHKTFIFLKYIH